MCKDIALQEISSDHNVRRERIRRMEVYLQWILSKIENLATFPRCPGGCRNLGVISFHSHTAILSFRYIRP